MEHNPNKQLCAREYSREYSAHEQQPIQEVISEHSRNILQDRPSPKGAVSPAKYP